MKPIHRVLSMIVLSGLVAAAVIRGAQTQTASAPASTASAPASTRATQSAPATAATVPMRERPVVPPPAAKTGSLTGRMLDAGGKGVAGAIILYSSREPGPIGEPPVPQVTTAPDGTFTIPNFPAGPRHSTLTVMQLGRVIGTVELDTNVIPGSVYRLDGDIRLGGAMAVPVQGR